MSSIVLRERRSQLKLDAMSDTNPLRSLALWRKLVMAVATAIPVFGFLVAIAFVNRPEPIVLGLPLMQFWTALCVLLTGACLTLVYQLDPRNAPEQHDENAP
ncbi:DUF3311 domain-containing protein [Segniliparus rotundus]|nr:DUF3311 domain-containing protein [Segniliparus rotundus]